MRLFITGGTGFIGSYVLAASLAAGHEVVALRRSHHSHPVIPLPSEPHWCEGDLANLQVSQFHGVDALVHLASAGVNPKPASWRELVRANAEGSLRLMELGTEAGVRRYVVAGSSHEYGNAARRYDPIPPDAPLEPLSPYGASKAAGFQLLQAFAIASGSELFYGRIFTAYGEGQFEGNFWPSLRSAALSGKDFLMTSGRQVSDFVSVEVVANHLLAACIRPDVAAGVPLVVNVGSGQATSLLAFAQAEWDRLGAIGRLLPGSLPDRADQIERYVPDLRGLQIPASTHC
ncbi:NAD-dependent epimerase/dehydratase family protein [Cyanobium sp. Aljojuca 7D2]|uniref:NAD-dependent epimerase/dehydratase family protein n=1 Tax=Cyanobium sp. Aljojuca 7D2 TaxID=2823698 RepID=UPI0020CEA302|nr:NAD-dependent epimerase/dehydratase family protein [Cyanobium sp. Aljojuca 7D2]MCP9891630.1 NAD-dependent epimerase/dehydratase family protein [Cyanobium sp. Aljojuca 7D2]